MDLLQDKSSIWAMSRVKTKSDPVAIKLEVTPGGGQQTVPPLTGVVFGYN
jgi:hypothetical protein